MTTLPLLTTEGVFLARYSENGLAELHFPGGAAEENGRPTGLIYEWHSQTTRAVVSVMKGRNLECIPPLDLYGHTEFRMKVWKQLQRIPLGKTVSYAEVAAAVGEPGATRAVGGACGVNPIPLIIPCHRVVSRTGESKGLGGFSGGLVWKRKLLLVEGVKLGREVGQKQEVLRGFEKLF